MTLLNDVQDGFDYVSTTPLTEMALRGWSSTAGTISQVSPGRNSQGLAVRVSAGGNLRRAITNSQSTRFYGFAFKRSAASEAVRLGEFRDGSGVRHLLAIDATGVLHFIPGSTLAFGSSALAASVTVNDTSWHYVTTFLDARASGVVKFWVDGLAAGSATFTTTAATLNAFQLANGAASATFDFDDFYVDFGAETDTPTADVRIVTRFPDSDVTVAWATVFPASPTTHFSKVDQNPAVTDDSVYIQDGTPGTEDILGFPTFGTTSADVLHVVKVAALAKDTGGTSGGLKLIAKRSGSQVDSPAKGLTGSYAYVEHAYHTDPNTGSSWDQANLDATDFGVKVA